MQTFYMLKHLPTGRFMPLKEKGYGYSHWDPDEGHGKCNVPRLFVNIESARAAASSWCQGKWCCDIETEDDGWRSYSYRTTPMVYERCPERNYKDLEIVEISLEVEF